MLNEWIADAHIHGDYWSESVARQNKIVYFYNTARNIARKLGGDIVLDVQYTPGARFIMTLPFS